jgi:aryl-alcohol dehydrogenase-like predicted oxidoreductase
MQQRRLGQTDLELSPVILGTWALGGWLWGGTASNKPDEAISTALDNGINCIDTAPAYGFGLSEELVGEAIKGRRDDVIVATKCGLVWDDRPGGSFFFDTKDNQGKPLKVNRNLRKESILKECDDSLLRLGVDVIDLYQCHWSDPETPLDDTLDALVTLRDRGKIREFGVSNFSAEEMQTCLKYSPIASDQPKYSLLSREVEDEVLPFCIENSIGVLCYSPMEMGLLTGKILAGHEFPDNDTRKTRPWFQPGHIERVLEALEVIRPIAEKHDATLAQLSVAWILGQPGVTAAIVGARNADQALSNAAAASLTLQDEDLTKMREIFETLRLEEAYDPSKAKR